MRQRCVAHPPEHTPHSARVAWLPSVQAVCFADAKMQMVAEYYAQQFNKRSPPDAKVAFVVSQVG